MLITIKEKKNNKIGRASSLADFSTSLPFFRPLGVPLYAFGAKKRAFCILLVIRLVVTISKHKRMCSDDDKQAQTDVLITIKEKKNNKIGRASSLADFHLLIY